MDVKKDTVGVMRMARCNRCNAPILWVKTPTGRMNCLNAEYIPYQKNKQGKGLVVSDNGEAIRCSLYPDNKVPYGRFPTGKAHLMHRATCPYADESKGEESWAGR